MACQQWFLGTPLWAARPLGHTNIVSLIYSTIDSFVSCATPSWRQVPAVCISQFPPGLAIVCMSDSANEPFGFLVVNLPCPRCSIPSPFTIMVRSTTNHKRRRTPSRHICGNSLLGGEGTSTSRPNTTWVISHHRTAIPTILHVPYISFFMSSSTISLVIA